MIGPMKQKTSRPWDKPIVRSQIQGAPWVVNGERVVRLLECVSFPLTRQEISMLLRLRASATIEAIGFLLSRDDRRVSFRDNGAGELVFRRMMR